MQAKPLTDKQKFWYDHLRAQRESGLTRRKYCEQHDLKLDLMSYYASLLRKKAASDEIATNGFVRLNPSPIDKKLIMRLSNGISIECPLDRVIIHEVLKTVLEIDQ